MPKPTLKHTALLTVQEKGVFGHFLRPSTSCRSERSVSHRELPTLHRRETSAFLTTLFMSVDASTLDLVEDLPL